MPGRSGFAAPILARMDELRVRVRIAVVAFVAAFAIAYAFAQDLFVLLALPLVDAWYAQPASSALGPPTFYFGSLSEPFWAYLRQSVWAGLFIASPVVFHQLAAFIAPGWYRRGRLAVAAFTGIATLFFVAGALFCYLVVMPLAYDFFLGYSTSQMPSSQVEVALQPRLFIADYLSFARALMLGFGLVFELPVVIYALVRAGIVTYRGLWRFNRWATVVAFSVAALLTPGPDVVSQLLMAIPLVALYNASILVAYLVGRRRQTEADSAAAAQTITS